jgi:predicted nucleic acid-binding protein
LVAAERGDLDIEAILERYAEEDFALSVVTVSELLHGVHRADGEKRRSRREAYVEAILARFPVLAFDLVAARLHSRLNAELSSKGVNIGAHDLIIVATALARGLDIATRDERSFPHIPGLSLIRW